MAKSKAKPANAKSEAPEAKAFRHTRTGAIRRSTSTLGYPYVPADEPKATKAEGEA